MTQEKFRKVLDDKGYYYKIEGNKIVVIHKGTVELNSLTSIPLDMVFNNEGNVWLDSLASIPPGVVFNNKGGVDLDSLASIPPGVEFRNGGYLSFKSLTSLSPGVVFDNGGDIYLRSLVGGWFSGWKGNIEGIDNKRLLNKMISLGLFAR